MNAVKHAAASQIQLLVRKEGGNFLLQVIDNGRGVDTRMISNSAGFGIPSIRERIRNLGGEIQIDSKPGKGTTMTLKVPDQK